MPPTQQMPHTPSILPRLDPDAKAGLLRKHPGIIWSNPHPSDSALAAAILNSHRFRAILDLANLTGIQALRRFWQTIHSPCDAAAEPPHPTEHFLRLIAEAQND